MRRAEVLGSEIGANCGCFGLLRAFGGGLGGIGVFVDARGRFPAAANGRFEGAGGVLPANPADRRGAEGRAGMTLPVQPAVFVPVGTPGIDHAGHLFRTDRVVALPLARLRNSDLPSVSQVVEAIEEALSCY